MPWPLGLKVRLIAPLHLAKLFLRVMNVESRESEILAWLSSHKYSRTHHDICAKRVASTGQWLLEHSDFHAWINDSNSTLWASGGPGVGKSVLV